jgi:amylosucrase
MVNPHLFAFHRYVQTGMNPKVVVIANFDVHPQRAALHLFKQKNLQKAEGTLIDLCSGQTVQIEDDAIILPKLTAYWLAA